MFDNPDTRQEVHVFDVDGTLTYHDSLLLLIHYCLPSTLKRWRLWLFVLPVAVGAIIKRDIGKIKEAVLCRLWKGWKQEAILEICKDFFNQKMKSDLREHAVRYIKTLEQKNPKVKIVLLSASCKEWLLPLAKELHASLVCTELLYDDNYNFTGLFATPNCKSKEKLRRLLLEYPKAENIFICYGNTVSDKYLQSVSSQFFYRYF